MQSRTAEELNCNGSGRNRPWPTLKTYYKYLLEGTEKKHTNPGQGFEGGCPKQEAAVLLIM